MSYQEQLTSLRAERANLAKAMAEQGLSPNQIAGELGVSRPTVLSDLKTVGYEAPPEKLTSGVAVPPAAEELDPMKLAAMVPRDGMGL